MLMRKSNICYRNFLEDRLIIFEELMLLGKLEWW